MSPFYPGDEYGSAYDIPFDELYETGFRGIIFDTDNTLVGHGAPADERCVKLFEKLRSMGFKTCILTNNKESRIKPFADAVSSPYIYRGGKPSKKGYIRSMELMGTGTDNTMVVGDQIFTDIWGANRTGLYSILVKPIGPDPEIQIVIKRFFEKPVLYYYHK